MKKYSKTILIVALLICLGMPRHMDKPFIKPPILKPFIYLSIIRQVHK